MLVFQRHDSDQSFLPDHSEWHPLQGSLLSHIVREHKDRRRDQAGLAALQAAQSSQQLRND